ncbi:PIN domain-containing protein [Nonomuraea sp. 10N515B]|uniref:PIN domain-containing protein n=1 Tax=Nonomuraea sp. 10N515B TaxID=3457422 RepID=UPI003FCD2E9F
MTARCITFSREYVARVRRIETWADRITTQPLRIVDLLLCATAVHHGLTALHVDDDFATVAKVMTEVEHRDIRRF